MKKILLNILALFFALAASAQNSITVDPGIASGTGPASSPDISIHAQVTNTSPDTIELMWSRTVQAMEHDWTTWICDLNNCYLPHIEVCPANRPNILAPGTSFELQVHVNPAGVHGEADILVHFYPSDDPLNILGSMQTHFETTTTSVRDLGNPSIRIYPNPTTSYFQLSESSQVARVAIYSIVGNKMREFDARNQSRFDVADLPEGIYLVRLLDAKQTVLKTVRLSKR
ncbi:MAG TPA: T9SS type A sorting domain-containing protein [Saprospiraceae bacterium]|nr:T9SS type A sorting domain-containing protein [Saprospiraceae bacterium]